jgi:microcystin degradation protein MlrC
MITHQEQFLTSRGPMQAWFELARELEARPKLVSVSTFPMQPWLDVANAGWSVVVITDGDVALGEEAVDTLCECAWDLREEFSKRTSVAPERAIRSAQREKAGLTLLSDTGDSIVAGAAGDNTTILEALLAYDVGGVTLLTIVDPRAVASAVTAGVGASLTLNVGGTRDREFSSPVRVRATVAGIAGNPFNIDGMSSTLGRAALLEQGAVKLVVCERAGIGENHPSVYRQFGLIPENAKVIVVKTGSNFQYYDKIATSTIRVDTPGQSQSDLERFSWSAIPRPMYPFDNMSGWTVR